MDSSQPVRSSIAIPAHLASRRLPAYNQNPLSLLQQKHSLLAFADINDDILRACYHADRTLFWRLVNQLAFFGVGFNSDALRSFTIVPNPEAATYLVYPIDHWDNPLELPGDSPARNQLMDYGIHTVGCLVGVPTESIARLRSGDAMLGYLHGTGYQSVSLAEFERRLREHTDSTDEHEPHPYRVQETASRYAVPSELLDITLTEVEWPDCPGVIRALRGQGITHLGQLPLNLDAFLIALHRTVGNSNAQAFKRRLKTLLSAVESSSAIDEIHSEFIEGQLTNEQLAHKLRRVHLEGLRNLADIAVSVEVHARQVVFPVLLDKALSFLLPRTGWKDPVAFGDIDALIETVPMLPRKRLEKLHTIAECLLLTPDQRVREEMQSFWHMVRGGAPNSPTSTANWSSW